MANLPALRVFLTADTNKYNKGMTKAQLTAKKFAAGIKKTAATMLGFVGAIGGTVAALNRMAAIGDDIGKQAKRIGVTAEAWQKLSFAARRTGSDQAEMETGMRRMASTIYDAERGVKASVDALADLGLVFDDLKGKGTEQQFALLAEQINNVTDATDKSAIAQDIFGRAGTKLIPMLAEYKELADEAERIGLITNKNIKASEEFKDSMENLSLSIKSAAINMGALQKASEWMEGAAFLAKSAQKPDSNLGKITDVAKWLWKYTTPQGLAGQALVELTDRMIKTEGSAAPIAKAVAEQQAKSKARRDAAEEKRYAGINKAAREATEAEYKMRSKITSESESVFGAFNKILGAMTGNMEFVGDFLGSEWEQEQAKKKAAGGGTTADGRSTMLAQALQAGSREAFGLLVKGRDADGKKKTDKRNLKANEDAAMGIGIMATQGITLKNVSTVNSF